MKRIIFMALSMLILLNVDAQQYYRMFSGTTPSGENDYVVNLTTSTDNSDSGILFSTGKTDRGFINSWGRWAFLKPGGWHTVKNVDNIIKQVDGLTMAIEGTLWSEKVSVRDFVNNGSSSLDFSAYGGKSIISSNNDNQGLHIQSTAGKSIYLYDKIYFNDKFWITLGPGRHDDPTIENAHIKMFRFASKGGIGFWTDGNAGINDSPNMQLNMNGSLTLGNTSNTSSKLNIGGTIFTESNGVKTFFGKDSDKDDAWFGTKSAHGLYLGTNSSSQFYIDVLQHNVYIGLVDTDVAKIRTELKDKYKLFVAKGILSEDFGIAPMASWSDFVFNKEYKLKDISEVESFISENKHLPDVPSAQQVAKEGYSQHEMNKILLQKIEELTLYIIQQQKEIENLKSIK